MQMTLAEYASAIPPYALSPVVALHDRPAQIDGQVRPSSFQELGIHAATIDEGPPYAVGVAEVHLILHKLVPAGRVYARLAGEQDRERYRSLPQIGMRASQERAAKALPSVVGRDSDASNHPDRRRLACD